MRFVRDLTPVHGLGALHDCAVCLGRSHVGAQCVERHESGEHTVRTRHVPTPFEDTPLPAPPLFRRPVDETHGGSAHGRASYESRTLESIPHSVVGSACHRSMRGEPGELYSELAVLYVVRQMAGTGPFVAVSARADANADGWWSAPELRVLLRACVRPEPSDFVLRDSLRGCVVWES